MSQQEILQNLGIEALNAMQLDAIATARRSAQVVLLAPTGSGKTLAYLLPIVERLMKDVNEVSTDASVMVLVPSRELAAQTVDVVKQMKCGLRALACYGGRPTMDEHRQMRQLQPHIVVCTPGRAADHLRKGNLRGEEVRTLVIDEFDKSLELGFRAEMAEVIGLLPRVERRFLLSATPSDEIPAFVGSNRFETLDFRAESDRIHLHLVCSPEKDKLHTLGRLLCHIGAEQSMVFVGYRENAERVAAYLRSEGFSVSAFHGGMEQRDRERALCRFAGGSALTLVCTDLAARGLDIDSVRNVIHYHIPSSVDAFTHRNGRTARWDREGEAWLIDYAEGRRPGSEVKALSPELERLGEIDFADVLTEKELTSDIVPQSLYTSLYIGRGRKDKVNRVDIVGFLSKQGGLRREELGRVDVGDHWAYAAVAREKADEVLRLVRGQKIKGQKTIIEKALT